MIVVLVLLGCALAAALAATFFLAQRDTARVAEWMPGINFTPDPVEVAPMPAPLTAEEAEREIADGLEALHRGRTRQARDEIEQLIMRVRHGAERRDIVDDLLEVHRILTTVGGSR